MPFIKYLWPVNAGNIICQLFTGKTNGIILPVAQPVHPSKNQCQRLLSMHPAGIHSHIINPNLSR